MSAAGRQTTRDAPRDDLRPAGADESPTTGGTLRRTWSEFREDGLTDWAAALTYYGLLSLFPALLAIASLVGLVADPRELTDAVLEIAPASTAESLEGPIDSITSSPGAAGLALVLGLAGALWGASGYVGGFARASNAIYEVRQGAPLLEAAPSPGPHGSWPRPGSPSTSPSSPVATAPTERSGASSCSSCGCGSPTWPSCSGRS